MNRDEWRDFLREVSRVLLAKDVEDTEDVNRPHFAPEVRALGYVGYAGASEEQIVAAETRLGVRFPPSFRTFLCVSNGWPEMWHSVDPGQLWSTENIRWAREQDPELVEIFGQPYYELSHEEHLQNREPEASGGYRHQYVANLLSISEHGDSDLLLSPEVVDEDGEWECWQMAGWIGGANRYRSFKEWFQAALQFHVEID